MPAGLAQHAVEPSHAVQHFGEEDDVQILNLALVREQAGSRVFREAIRGHGRHRRGDAHGVFAFIEGDSPGRVHVAGGPEPVLAPVLSEDVGDERIEFIHGVGAHEPVPERPPSLVVQRLEQVHRADVVTV